ncbi:unnamed protein product [Acanthoscelides obtectus]|uniref:Uncharacterized protein n=1 Tax=Acanthoscelides obtectus TaxID=200917 RepID=A0A9P0KQH7_ACAOB|nr:unnamed protein product [Acanthoscelides obtectus]CAK1674895.1 hypothetical protein AOBTE_LOCUS29801 [Acanthoscelides obtectus]
MCITCCTLATGNRYLNTVIKFLDNYKIFGTPGVTFVRRRVGEEFNQEYVVPTLKHGGGSVMVWGCMSASGVGEMFVCEGRMDATKSLVFEVDELFCIPQSGLSSTLSSPSCSILALRASRSPIRCGSSLTKVSCLNTLGASLVSSR